MINDILKLVGQAGPLLAHVARASERRALPPTTTAAGVTMASPTVTMHPEKHSIGRTGRAETELPHLVVGVQSTRPTGTTVHLSAAGGAGPKLPKPLGFTSQRTLTRIGAGLKQPVDRFVLPENLSQLVRELLHAHLQEGYARATTMKGDTETLRHGQGHMLHYRKSAHGDKGPRHIEVQRLEIDAAGVSHSTLRLTIEELKPRTESESPAWLVTIEDRPEDLAWLEALGIAGKQITRMLRYEPYNSPTREYRYDLFFDNNGELTEGSRGHRDVNKKPGPWHFFPIRA